MKSKKEYISPAVDIMFLATEKLLAAVSGGENPWSPAKKHKFFFDDWDNEEEETSLPKNKSVWDD